MSAAKQRRPARSGRSSSRHREPQHVAPVLDPTWHSPYTPTSVEREANRRAIRASALRRSRPLFIGATALFVGTVALGVLGLWNKSVGGWWWPLIGLMVLGAVVASNELRCRRLESSVTTVAERIGSAFRSGGTTKDALRAATIVDRLSATFGLAEVKVTIVDDDGYNAALLPDVSGLSLLVTSAMMRDFELIEVEGVIAHLMARQRLGLLERLAAASIANLSFDAAHELAGTAVAYRADEIAAAGIRYPQGLAQALARCAAQRVPSDSYFATEQYGATRWLWFDLFADRESTIEGDLDNTTVRSRALAEW